MKRVILCLLTLCLLAGFAAVLVPQANAAEHSHCVCGGSAVGLGDHTQCQNITWEPLSSVATLSKVDFGTIASGNYYLDGNVTVTGWSSLGQKNSDSLATTPAATVELRLCLNGYSVTSRNRVFGPIYMGSQLSICDCSGRQASDGSWSWQGSMSGGGNTFGGIIYGHAGSRIDVYGGNLTGKAIQLGGAFVAASDSCGDLNNDNACTDADKKIAKGCVLSLYNGVVTGSKVEAVLDANGKASFGSGGTIDVMHSAVFNMYGGTVTGGSAVAKQGTNGLTGGKGGNIFASGKTTINIQGGTISGGQSSVAGGNIYTTASLNIENAVIINGTSETNGNVYPEREEYYAANTIYGGYPECVHVVTVQDGKEVLSREYTLANALKNLKNNSYLKLMRDLSTDTEISGAVYLDMNGCDLSGVTVSGTVYGFDSVTDSYTGDDGGKLTGTVTGQVLPVEQYLMVNEEGYSFHRYDVKITHLSLKPANAAMGYKAKFQGDDAIARNVAAFGYEMWLEGYNPCTYSSKTFTSGKELTLRLQNILSEENSLEENLKNAETKIYAKAFIQLQDGTKVSCGQVEYDLKEMLHMADDSYASYNAAQQAALQTLAGKFSETMMTWDVENFHHASGGIWTALNQKGFISKLVLTKFTLSEETTYNLYCLPEGHYVLTEDVDLGGKTLGFLPGTKTTICLNGHTITSSSRTLRIVGQLDLCDCHAAGQEGMVTSTYTNLAPVFYVYWEGQFNLYGGNLYASLEGQSTAGVGGVSHDGGTLNADKIPGVMNMYGGAISCGSTLSGNGGLVSLWNGSTMNMYSGEMFGGSAAKGGAVCVSSKCTFNMYGGSIHDNTAAVRGGAISLEAATATANLYGGTITGNTAPVAGGLYSKTAAVTLGNTITGNSSGVYAHVGTVELTGSVKITENTEYNLNLSGSVMKAADLEPTAQVGLTTRVRGYLSDDVDSLSCFRLEDTENLTIREFNGKLMLVPEDQESFGSVNTFSVGYSTICSNPENPVGLPLAGYGNTSSRLSTQVIDDLYVSVVAMTDAQNNTVLLYTCDIQRIPDDTSDNMRLHISNSTGVPVENIFISSTHTHSAPDLTNSMEVINDYIVQLTDHMVQIALEAMADRMPAQAQYGAMEVERMNFVRHYYYYDENGQKQYCGDNFGLYPSNRSASNLFHATEGDHSLQLIRFVRDGKDVVLANWAAHPHFTGGSAKTDISSDYVGPFRDAVQANEDCYFAFIQGSGGNMNETSNITGEHQFSNALNKNNTARTLYGQKMAEYVSQVLENMTDVPTGLIQTDGQLCTVPINHTEDERVEEAQALRDVYFTWKDETFPKENGRAPNSTEIREFCMSYGFQNIYHAGAVIGKASRGDSAQVEVNTFSIGTGLGFYTGPGELWSDTALEIKEGSPFLMTFTVGYTNQNWNYFPDGIAAGGYENYESQLSHLLFPDTINILKEYWHAALDRLYENAQ